MAVISSDVYDIFHPTPVSLLQLSSIAASHQVWRCKVNEYRNNCSLEKFNPFYERTAILMKTLLPDLPSMINTVIHRYIRRFRALFENWLKEHHARIFHYYYDHQNTVLEHFDDFVCDYNGVIHYVRTAERMMHCDRFDDNLKFVIACTYFFEDDIRRLWPSVSENMHLNNIDFSKSPQLYYWIRCLRNELDKIPVSETNNNIDKVMLDAFMSHNRPSLEYFWNRISTENRLRKAVDIFTRDAVSFVRFILPKLDNQQLNEFVNERTYELIRAVYINARYDAKLIPSTWVCIKKTVNKNSFIDLVWKMVRSEIVDSYVFNFYNPYNPRVWPYACCAIWMNAAEDWKRSALTYVTSTNNQLFEDLSEREYIINVDPKEFIFLSCFLSYATSEERKRLWYSCWNNLLKEIRCADWPKIMKLFLENEDEIAQFKETVMVNSPTISLFCLSALCGSHFDDLDDCASFLFSEEQAARNFKQQLLQEHFLRTDDVVGNVSVSMILQGRRFSQFIYDAYGNVEQSAEFKNQLMSLPSTRERLLRCASSFYINEELMEFIDAFVLEEDTLQLIKARMIDALRKKAAADKSVLSESSSSFLSWCFGSDEEVEKFMLEYSS